MVGWIKVYEKYMDGGWIEKKKMDGWMDIKNI